jgi:L-2-hydroxyglutarate oxidase LhgO
VATNDLEQAKIEGIYEQGLMNGVEGLSFLTGSEAQALEPNLSCTGAVLSRETGIIDSHALMLAFQGDLESAGGAIAFHAPVQRISQDGAAWNVTVGGADPADFTIDAIVNAAGLGAQGIARATEGYPLERVPPLVLAKGNYFGCLGKPAFSRLIYPAPVDGGLGTHVTLDLAGRMRFGPDVEIRAGRKASTPPSAATGRGCPMERWYRIMRASARSSRGPARRPRISWSTARQSMGCRGWCTSSASKARA